MPEPTRKLLVLGAGIFQVPLIQTAQAMGLYVVALSYLPHDPGLALANKSYVVSTINKEEVLKIARAENIAGIITVASEVAAPTAAWVAGQLKLPGYSYQAAVTVANKLQLRNFLANKGLSDMRYHDASTPELARAALNLLKMPLMLKPLLSSGSRGIKLVTSAEEAEKHLEKAIAESFIFRGALLEEFLEGRAIGGELLICNGHIAAHAFSDKFLNGNFVTTAHLMPARLSEKETSQILNLLGRVVTGLGLKNGALDIDLVVTPNGPEIIELGGRLGGNAMAELASRHTGTNFLQAAIKLALGENITPANEPKIPVAAHIIGSKTEGKLKRIRRFSELFPDRQPTLLRQSDFAMPGTCVQPLTQGNYQLGNLILTAPTLPELAILLAQVQEQNWAVVE